jgi:hypothetical protein
MTKNKNKPRGNCYVAVESLFHLLGGRAAGYKPMVMRHEGDTHWFLIKEARNHYASDIIIDPTVSQFKTKPDYSKARGCGFLTKKPSKRARELMKKIVWQGE